MTAVTLSHVGRLLRLRGCKFLRVFNLHKSAIIELGYAISVIRWSVHLPMCAPAVCQSPGLDLVQAWCQIGEGAQGRKNIGKEVETG